MCLCLYLVPYFVNQHALKYVHTHLSSPVIQHFMCTIIVAEQASLFSSVHKQARVLMSIRMYIHAQVHTYVCTYMHMLCIEANAYVRTYVQVCLRAFVFTHVYMMLTYVHKYTRIFVVYKNKHMFCTYRYVRMYVVYIHAYVHSWASTYKHYL